MAKKPTTSKANLFKAPAPAGNPLFDQIDNLWLKEKPVYTDTKPESIYMTTRFLSLTTAGFMASIDLNSIRGLPEEAKLPFLYHSLPKAVPQRGKYPKIEKNEVPAKRKKALDRICKIFGITEFHGLQVMTLLEQQGFNLESE